MYNIVYIYESILICDAIWIRLYAFNINVPKGIALGILLHQVRPLPHRLHENLLEPLLAEIDRFLVPANHAHQGSGRHAGQAKVSLVQPLLDSSFDPSGEDVGAEAELFANGATESDAVDDVKGLHHGANGLETTRYVDLGLVKGGDDGFCEFEEEGFALLGALLLVGESLNRNNQYLSHLGL